MATYTGNLMESYVPCVKYGGGIRSNLDVSIGDGATVTLPSTTTIGGSSVVALGDITSSSTSASAFTVTNTGIFTGVKVVGITADSATTGTIIAVSAAGLTSGHAMVITAAGTIVTTGDAFSVIANSATTSTGIVRVSATGLTDGFALTLTGGGANATASGGVINVVTGAATLGTAVAITNTSGVYVGTTGLLAITANSATTGSIAVVTANGLTTGHALTLTSSGVLVTTGDMLAIVASGATTATGVVRITTAGLTTGAGILITANALTSGNCIRVQSSSTDTTAHNLIHVINSGTASIASLFGGTQVVISTHFRKILTESGSGTTLYFSDGTTANGALTGVAGDICFNAGSNKPEYCSTTGTTWAALV